MLTIKPYIIADNDRAGGEKICIHKGIPKTMREPTVVYQHKIT